METEMFRLSKESDINKIPANIQSLVSAILQRP